MRTAAYLAVIVIWAALVPATRGLAANYAYPPPVDHSASQSARAAIEKATADLRQFQEQAQRTWRQKTQEFEASSEYTKAQAAQKAAHADFDTTRAATVAALGATAPYRQAQERERAAKAKVEAVKNSPLSNPEDIAAASQDLLARDRELLTLEEAAVAADPKAAQAKARYAETSAKVTTMRRSFESALRDDPDLVAQRRRITDVERSLAPLQDSLRAALFQEEEAERSRQLRVAAIEHQRAADAEAARQRAAAARAHRGRRR